MAIRIRIEHGQDAGKTMRLATPGRYRFGRQPGLEVQVLDMKVSKEHFELLVANGASGGAGIKDLASSHGTWLNGQKVSVPRPIVPGDEIRVGMTVIRVMSDGPADAELKGVAPIPLESEWAPAAAAAPATSTTMTSQALSGSSPNALAGSGVTKGAKAANGSGGGAQKPAAPPDPLVGTTLAGYKILERVGAGGMGAVYKAEQLSLHREVAMKVLAEKLVSDSAFVDQFVNEARAAGALNHPNVVQVYDVGHADGRHYFSMEFIHGGSLEERVRKPGKAKWQEALPWFLDAANALIFAEKKGILHRDIKPDNLMLSQDGTVKLCDLGLAKKSESADLLAQGIIGTPHFIAPEAVRRKVDVDKRADLYSLGCTFYRILTGKNPYPAASVKEILLAHLNQPVPHVTSIATEVPKEIDEVVFKLMQKEASARFQGADEVWKALDKIRLQHGMEAHGLHPGRAKKVAILVGLVALAAIGVAVYFVTRPKQIDVVDRWRERTDVPPGLSLHDKMAMSAQIDLGKIRSEASEKIGKLEDGANWKDPRWTEFVKRYREFAANPDYKEFPESSEAAKKAEEIQQYIDRMRAQEKRTAEEREAKQKDLADVLVRLKEGLDPLRKDAKYSDAAIVIAKASKEIDALADEKPPLLTKEEIEKTRIQVRAARSAVEAEFMADWGAVAKAAQAAEALGTPDGLTKADELYQDFLTRVAEVKGGDELGTKINAARVQASQAHDRISNRMASVRALALTADRNLYFGNLQLLYGSPGDDAGTLGHLVSFRFAAAKAAAQKLANAMQTPEYRALATALYMDADHLSALFSTRLTEAFGKKPWDDKVKAEGMTSPAKIEGFTPEGFVAGGKAQRYDGNKVSWLIASIFYTAKGEEHFAMSADDHEALGALAEASGVVEPADTAAFELAGSEWDKAAKADPSRAERVEARKAHAKDEKTARQKVDEAWQFREWVNSELNKFDPKLLDKEYTDKVKNEMKSRAQEFTDALEKAKKDLEDVEKDFASTFVAAVMAQGVPPALARYGGESRTPPPPPAPAAGTLPKPGNTPPAPPPGQPPSPPQPPGPAMDGAGGMVDDPNQPPGK